MHSRNHTLILLFILLGMLSAGNAEAQLTSLRLRATPRTTLLADGKQSTDIIAEVRDNRGNPAGNVTVQFSLIGSGTLSDTRVQAFGGVARVRLTSAPIPGVAKVTAYTPGGGSASLDFFYTDDPQALFEGNMYLQITGRSYLAYSATEKVIEAQGKNSGAKMSYRNLEIEADRMVVQCEDYIVRAHNNVVLKRAGHTVKVSRLYFSMRDNSGYAIGELNGKLQPLIIEGENLVVRPCPTPIPNSYIVFPELSTKLVIVARSIVYFPNERIQFRRPKIYQNGTLLMSVPFYEMAWGADELFSDQFISVGTNGFGLELPFYYDLTPRTQGIVYLRHQQQSGRSYYSNSPGWSLDLLQNYSNPNGQRTEGSFGFTGLTRSDWGFRWNHNQEFNGNSQGTFYLDFPQHRSVIGSVNYTQQGRRLRWGTNLAAGQTLAGIRETSTRADMFVETQPRALAKSKDWMYTVGSTFTTGSNRTNDAASVNFSQTSQNLNMRAFTRPLNFGPNSTLTSSVTLGQVWTSTNNSGLLALATLGFEHRMGNSSINLFYDFTRQPDLFTSASGKHRLSMTYNMGVGRKFSTSVSGSMMLDTSDTTVWGDMIYRLDNNWRMISSLTLQRYAGESFSDIQLTLGRRIGAREVQLTYSTYLHRFSFDLTATRF